jgi:arginyl-tRNA synthetase
MPDARSLLHERLQAAFDTVVPGADPVLRVSDRADFQANGALALARQIGRNPREVADAVVAAAQLADVCDRVEVSGPGFINLSLSGEFLSAQVTVMADDARLGVAPAATPRTVVIDYSSPNVAKEMHVGHLRTTVIGDSLCRLFGFLGHRVVRENHIGDWGTPFGMLIEHLLDLGEEKGAHELSVGDLDTFYRQARGSFDADETFRERSRARVVLLQAGDPETLRLWQVLVAESVAYFDEVYQKLGVLLTDDDIRGESAYNPMLAPVVTELDRLGLLVEDDGAQCVFPDGFTNRQGDPLPLIIQKSDGGFGYAATDLAALRDRVDRIGADLVLYVVGAPQSQHLEMCFAVARMAGWLVEPTEAVHVSFGNVLGSDHKMFQTRAGSRIKLVDLLDEGVARAGRALRSRRGDASPSGDPTEPSGDPTEPSGDGSTPPAGGPGLGDPDLSRALGIGAVKYADLSTDRTRDYAFDWERMLAFEGNTGPYLQYAHARIRSIFRRGGVDRPGPGAPPIVVDPHERSLALALLGFEDAVREVVATYNPSKLAAYLFSLATAFTSFYENCPVLRAADEETRRGRLVLSDLTARVLACGLDLLGMSAPDQM